MLDGIAEKGVNSFATSEGDADEEPMNSVESVGRTNRILILVSGCVVAYLSWSLYSAPIGAVTVGVVLPLILASALLFNRLMLVAHRVWLSDVGGFFHTLMHVARWILTLVLSSVFLSVVNGLGEMREQREIADEFAPLLGFIEQSVARDGKPPEDLADYLKSNPIPLRFFYQYGNGRYIIVTRGGSIDIDGSTVFYSSKTRDWSRIHNDALKPNSRHPVVLDYFEMTKDLPSRAYP